MGFSWGFDDRSSKREKQARTPTAIRMINLWMRMLPLEGGMEKKRLSLKEETLCVYSWPWAGHYIPRQDFLT